jgi:hypothetical protein
MDEPTQNLMNPNQIANKMNRTRRAVVINLDKIGVEPKLKVGRAYYYDPDEVIPKLTLKMRRENWNKRDHKKAQLQPA